MSSTNRSDSRDSHIADYYVTDYRSNGITVKEKFNKIEKEILDDNNN